MSLSGLIAGDGKTMETKEGDEHMNDEREIGGVRGRARCERNIKNDKGA